MPSFATAHTFCASQDGPTNLGFLRTIHYLYKGIFCAVHDYAGKEDLGKSKKKIWGNRALFRDD